MKINNKRVRLTKLGKVTVGTLIIITGVFITTVTGTVVESKTNNIQQVEAQEVQETCYEPIENAYLYGEDVSNEVTFCE